jgi:hypothetical protein
MSLDDEFRRIVREELDARFGPAPGSGGFVRHDDLFVNRPDPAAAVHHLLMGGAARWIDLEELPIKSGSRTFVTRPGYPVKVLGEGRGGATGSGFTVRRIQQNTSTGKVNVEVTRDRSGHSRTFPADKIVYQRPKAG